MKISFTCSYIDFFFQKYLYESRHRHALNRQRGSGGIFVNQPQGPGEPMPNKETSEAHETNTQTNGNAIQILSNSDVNIPVVTQAQDLLCLDT